MEKRSNNEEEKKKQQVKKCKTCEKKHQRDYQHFKTDYFICHNIGHIAAKCAEKSSSAFFSSLIKKKLCYTQKVTTQYHNSKIKFGQVLVSYLVRFRPQKFSVISAIIDFGVTDHFLATEICFLPIGNTNTGLRQSQKKKLQPIVIEIST